MTLTNGATKLIRCRNTTVTATPGGLLSGEEPLYSWSYEIVSGGTSKDRWLSDINAVINTVNSNNALRLTVPSTLTEKVTDATTIRFIVKLNVGTNQVSNTSASLLIEPYVFTLISNYSSSYTIFASDGLVLYPAFRYPECPVFKGPQALPSPTTLSCSLYDSKGNLIKSLQVCGLQPNEVSSGLSYQIRYYYVPNPYQVGISALRDSIIVNTIAQQPSCSIANASMYYVR